MSTTGEEFELEEEGTPPDQNEGLTPEEIALRAQDEQLRLGREALDKVNKFAPFIEALEKDPSKVFDMRAAIEGKRTTDAAPVVTQEHAPQLSAEQLEKINAEIQSQWLENPAAVLAWVKNNAKSEAYNQFVKDAQPVVDAVGGTFIDAFKRHKKENDRFYAAVLARFEEEVTDLPAGVLVNMPAAQRSRELERRWNAAKGEVLDKKIKPAEKLATSAGGGTSMGGSATRGGREKAVEMSAVEKDTLIRALGPEKAKARIHAIEYGEA